MQSVMLASLAVGLGAAAQAVTGFGFALVCGPFLVVALGPADGVRLTILLSCALNVLVLLREVRGVLIRDGALLLAPAAAVTPLAVWLTARADQRLLTVAAGVLTLLSTVALARGLRLRRLQGMMGAAIAGTVSAVMNAIGGLSGPAVALYAVNAEWPPISTRPTLQAYGLGLNIVALAVLGLPSLSMAAPLVIGLGVGGTVGILLAERLPQAGVQRITLLLAACGGLLAVAHGLARQ